MIDKLCQEWLDAKMHERSVIARRREIEDTLIEHLRINDKSEGTKRIDHSGFNISVEFKINRKVDGKKLIEVAASNGIGNDVLQQIFRWKPEINMRDWKSADRSIVLALSNAVTTSDARPSVSITKE
jgi:hypothetical protein